MKSLPVSKSVTSGLKTTHLNRSISVIRVGQYVRQSVVDSSLGKLELSMNPRTIRQYGIRVAFNWLGV